MQWSKPRRGGIPPLRAGRFRHRLSPKTSVNPPPAANFDNASADGPAELKRKSVRGGAVTLVAQAAGVLIHLTSTVVLARLLGPEEYGVMAMVLAVTAFAGLFRDLGLSSATIQRDKLSHDQLSTLFWINVAAGTVLTLLVAAAAPLVAWFYQRPELSAVTLVLSLKFLIGSFSTQQSALLTRQMRFGRKAAATLSGSGVTLVLAVLLALNGFSYWSLVWGGLAGAVVTTLLLNGLSGWRPGWPVRGAGVRSMLKYGANLTGFELVNYFHRNLDNILIGRFWGADALGLYSRAYQLLMFPIQNLRGPLNAVAFPAMSRLQKQPELFRAYYRRVTALLAFATMPLTTFLLVTSATLIELALGPRWLGVVPLFAVLAITGFIQPVASLRGLVLLSTGQGRRYRNWGILNAICVSLGFGVGIAWGPMGVAVAYALVSYAILYPSLRYAFHGTPLQTRDFFGPVARPALASLVAGLGTFFLKQGFWFEQNGLVLAACLAVFSLLYLALFLVLPGGAAELRGYLAFRSYFQAPQPIDLGAKA